MPARPSLINTVAALITRESLLPPGDVVVGLSGGPDSLCLLHLLADLASAHGWRLIAAHLDHGLRPASAAEVATVRALAAARGVPLRTQRIDVAATVAGEGLEAAARRARYQFLASVAADHGNAPVAVGHTEDDQAETLLLRLARGAGATGLAAMRPLTRLSPTVWGGQSDAPLHVARPLLTTSRATIEVELHRRGLTPLRDPSNNDDAIARNRLRHRLLPAWQVLEPNIGARLARTADLLAADNELLTDITAQVWSEVIVVTPGPHSPGLAFARRATLAQPLALRRRLFRLAVAALDGPPPTMSSIDAALGIAANVTGGQADLVAGIRLTVLADRLWIGHAPAPPAGPWMTPGGSVPLTIGSPTRLPGGAWTITCHKTFAQHGSTPTDSHTVNLAHALGTQALILRTPHPGDRIMLAAGRKKISDLLIDRKVPRADRTGVPLLVRGDEILWVVGQVTASSALPRGESSVLCCLVERTPI